ncbi:MAG: transporter [Pseudomonadota bacterium]
MHVLLGAAFLLALNLGTAQTVLAQSVSLSAGVDYSSGDYGTDDKTDILFAPISARVSFGDFTLRASIPFLSVDGPGDVIPGDGGPILTDTCARIQFTRPALFERFCQEEDTLALGDDGSASGLGDIVLGVSYTLPEEITGDFGLTFEGRIKLPTADEEQALGTGETDVALSVDLAWYGGLITPFATLGYRFLGDPTFTDELGDFTIDLQDGFTASAGLSIPLGKRSTLTFAYDYLERSASTVEDVHELYGGLSVPLSDAWSITGYGVAGLTNSSPDFAVGLSLRFRFRR